ncbi:type IX secretion system PorP/SprF family membrane protein [Flavobacterium sp. 28YEA47A]|uniref:PorP/SprF family type IX secretion system membrane protein n=1 Tax=Flavobacterium sp. 28YEA47A TaxID=3156276 RepID=UPI003515EC0E
MKITIYKISLAFLFILISIKTNAQQDPGYTQYMYNPLTINPGYAGSTGTLEAVLLHRSQWVGIDGAPSTQAFTLHSPLTNDQIGLGFTAVNDNLGPSNEIYFDGNFSYTLMFSYNTKLALGIKAGARVLNVDWSKGRFYDGSDVLLNSNINNKITPSIGAGAYLYSDNWYVGASVPTFIKGDYYDDIQESIQIERLHYYLIGGYVFNFSDNFKFKPAVLAKGVSGAPISVDFSANFLIQEKFTIGAGYRWDDSVSALLGFQISKDFFVGYSYDYTTTDLNKYNDGSHEIILRYQLSRKTSQIKSQRFF